MHVVMSVTSGSHGSVGSPGPGPPGGGDGSGPHGGWLTQEGARGELQGSRTGTLRPAGHRRELGA